MKKDQPHKLLQKWPDKIEKVPKESPVYNNLEEVPIPHIFDKPTNLNKTTSGKSKKSSVPIVKKKEPTNIGYSGIPGVVTLEEMRYLEVPESSFLIENLIVAGSLNLIAGEGGTGKSSLSSQMGISLCCMQKDFLGYTINATYNRVIYVSTEDGVVQIKKRTDKQTSKYPHNKDWYQNFGFTTLRQKALDHVKLMLQKLPADLVVIDNYNDIFDGDPNNSISVRSFFNQMQDLINEYGCAFLILTHVIKTQMLKTSNKIGILGSGAMTDKPRHVMLLNKDQRNPEHRTLKIDKSNYLSEEEQGQSINLKFISDSLTFSKVATYSVSKNLDAESSLPAELNNPNSESLNSSKKTTGKKIPQDLLEKAVEMKEKGSTLAEIAKVVKRDKSTISRWLSDAKE